MHGAAMNDQIPNPGVAGNICEIPVVRTREWEALGQRACVFGGCCQKVFQNNQCTLSGLFPGTLLRDRQCYDLALCFYFSLPCSLTHLLFSELFTCRPHPEPLLCGHQFPSSPVSSPCFVGLPPRFERQTFAMRFCGRRLFSLCG